MIYTDEAKAILGAYYGPIPFPVPEEIEDELLRELKKANPDVFDKVPSYDFDIVHTPSNGQHKTKFIHGQPDSHDVI